MLQNLQERKSVDQLPSLLSYSTLLSSEQALHLFTGSLAVFSHVRQVVCLGSGCGSKEGQERAAEPEEGANEAESLGRSPTGTV